MVGRKTVMVITGNAYRVAAIQTRLVNRCIQAGVYTWLHVIICRNDKNLDEIPAMSAYKYIFRRVLLFRHGRIVNPRLSCRYGPSGLFRGADKSVDHFGASYIDSTPQLLPSPPLTIIR